MADNNLPNDPLADVGFRSVLISYLRKIGLEWEASWFAQTSGFPPELMEQDQLHANATRYVKEALQAARGAEAEAEAEAEAMAVEATD